jgi:hypothetical protein
MPDMDKRLNYFTGQFLQQEDFTAEQEYHVDRQRRHSRFFHTPGIADGLNVTASLGATEVVVSLGTATDGEGRQIVLPENRTVRLEGFANQQLLLVISYREHPSDPATVGGGGDTRWYENPLLEAVPQAGAPPERTHIRLAGITTGAGGAITAHDPTVRVRAGAQVGDELSVRRLSLERPGDAPNQWPVLSSGATGRADLTGVLAVSGDLQVGGTLSGTLAANMVGTNQIANGAVNATKLTNNAVNAEKILNNAVTTVKLADSAVNDTKLANNAVTAEKLASHASNDVARAVTRQHIRNNAVGADQIENLAVNNAKLTNNAVTTDKIQNGAVDNVKLANDAVSAAKLDPSTRGLVNNALQRSGGTLQGRLDVQHVQTTWGIRILVGNPNATDGLISIVTPDLGTHPVSQPAAIAGLSAIANVHGVYARAPSGTHALRVDGTSFFSGQVTFGGGKVGYVVDTFINASGQRLRTGDIVRLKDTPVARFHGTDNKIPIAQITLADHEDDPKVIGIVDREGVPDPDSPDTRVEPEDPTAIEDGGEVLVVTLGAYSHCRVDATEHPIEVGDLLTTSSNPGHARKAVEPKLGTVIGKALEPLSAGTGYIAIFVNMH